jgi:hypothetical protein
LHDAAGFCIEVVVLFGDGYARCLVIYSRSRSAIEARVGRIGGGNYRIGELDVRRVCSVVMAYVVSVMTNSILGPMTRNVTFFNKNTRLFLHFICGT